MSEAEKPERVGLKTSYFTFGWGQAHHVGGYTFDPDTLVKITAPDPRSVMVARFGTTWGFEYDEPPEQRFWPRGMIDLSPEKQRAEAMDEAERVLGARSTQADTPEEERA